MSILDEKASNVFSADGTKIKLNGLQRRRTSDEKKHFHSGVVEKILIAQTLQYVLVLHLGAGNPQDPPVSVPA
jgi:hypothetical protein